MPASGAKGQGWATFVLMPGTSARVGALRSDDLSPAALKRLGKEQKEHFLATIELMKALESKDLLALEKARQRFEKWYAQKSTPDDPSAQKVGEAVAHVFGVTEREASDWFYGSGIVGHAKDDPAWLLSSEISDALREVRFVLWWTGRQFLPALYCPDVKTAFYTKFLLGKLGGKGIGVCPYCGYPFVKNRSDQVFCSTAHRDIHRVDRWRRKRGRERQAVKKTGRVRKALKRR